MTPDEIDTLPAGRELDALVAEKVFGRTIAGRGTAIFVEGEWSLHTDSEPDGWACHAGLEPLFVKHCQCEFLEEHFFPEQYSEARVAKHIADWGRNNPEEQEEVRRYYASEREKYATQKRRFGHYEGCLAVVPHYSTDIAAAWDVVEKLGYYEAHGAETRDCTWYLETADPNDIDGYGRATAATAPLAICRAALKAVIR